MNIDEQLAALRSRLLNFYIARDNNRSEGERLDRDIAALRNVIAGIELTRQPPADGG